MTGSASPVALVTGATSGIGRAVALKLAGDGFALVVHGRDACRGADVVAAIEAAGGQARSEGANPERIKALGATTLLGRAAQVGEIAEVIPFLASPKASYITGALIPVDGGRTAV